MVVALVRVRFITRTGRETAEDATQIFGGRSITASGMGKLIENVSGYACLIDSLSADFWGVIRLSSITAHLRTMRSSEVKKMCSAIWG